MSESIVKEECPGNFFDDISLHNIANMNKEAELEQNNKQKDKSDERYYPHEFLPKSPRRIIEVMVKEEIDVKEEPINIQDVDINLEKGIEVHEELIYFTEGNYLVKHEPIHGDDMLNQRTHRGEKQYQCSHCDKDFSTSSHLVEHQRTHTEEKSYQCSQCNQAFIHKSNLVQHLR
ncbi:unnamed protein product, partial [Meganyctiphanes norvegica]